MYATNIDGFLRPQATCTYRQECYNIMEYYSDNYNIIEYYSDNCIYVFGIRYFHTLLHISIFIFPFYTSTQKRIYV